MPKKFKKPSGKGAMRLPSRLSVKRKKVTPSEGYLTVGEDCIFRQESSELISMIDLRSNTYYHLNGFSAFIWLLLDGTRTRSQIIEICQAEFKITAKQLGKLNSFLNELLQAELIKEMRSSLKNRAFKGFKISSSKIKNNIAGPTLEKHDQLSALYLVSAGSSN